MKRPPESLKSFANSVGSVAASDEASEAVRLLHLAGFFDGSETNYIDGSDHNFTDPVPDQVGIWARKIENGKSCFVRRPETRREWLSWANLARIEPKGKKQRVVLIGESVTRGYLYDPQYTPALALQAMLDTQGDFEVIDLARTNLSYQVRALAIEALQLEPDIVIVFAGNNWSASGPTALEFAQIDAALSSEGITGARKSTEAQLLRKARRVVNDVSAAYESKGIPLVWIIPEFNLVDWRDENVSVPYLPAGLTQKWHILREEAQNALRDRNFERAENLARQMLEIDEGICPAALYILADCRQACGDLEAARKYFEMAKDASIWDLSRVEIPKPYSVTQRAMREDIPKYKNQLIDLPVVFKDYLEGGIPGRRLFLDYCHLTSEGIQIAMAAAATCVLRALQGVEVPWPSLIGSHSAPSAETEAEASFLAAILTAHKAPSPDVERHFCARALSYSPHAAELMLNYIDLQTRSSVPMLMSEADDQLHKLGSPVVHHYLLRLNEKRLDASLLDAIVDVLEEAGIDARNRLDQLRHEEHSVTKREINLLDYYFCSSVYQPLEAVWVSSIEDRRYQPDARYYKAYAPESRFLFVGEAESPVQLCLTCRLPESTSSQGSILVEANGETLAEIAAGSDWTTWDLTIDGKTVRDGLNEVTVSWPIAEFNTEQALKQAAMKMYEGKFPHFYPVFGEIHSFIASDGKKVQTGSEMAESSLVQMEV
ncbi:MAG TPA: hypothetical protein VLB46_17055 [Pyrinomonadaceae bacterium]|nr:hypothetical protein [Pyrinomonadaceae bacterium]